MTGIQKGDGQGNELPLVYLVDDERMVGDLAEIILKTEGFQTRLFYDPYLTLDAVLHDTPKPALLVTDYVMGEMNGLELIKGCREAHPEIKVILVSGTVDQDFIGVQVTQPDAFLAKPYRADALIRIARELLQIP